MSQFEREIKNVLENYEVPADIGAWNSMEKRMNAGNRSSFYKHFIVAGVVLTAALAVLNSDMGSGKMTHNDLNDTHNNTSTVVDLHDDNNKATKTIFVDENGNINSNGVTGLEDSSLEDAYSTGSMEAKNNGQLADLKDNVKMTKTTSSNESTDNLSVEEKNNLLKINEKIKEQADNNLITEYVGKSFNLNANNILTPNDDGIQDVFLPEAITAGDEFLMKIINQDNQMIFSTSNVDNPWTGYNQVTGKMCETGNYTWKVTLDTDNRKEIFTGIIMVK